MFLLLFSCSVLSDSLWPHGLQHARLPCPSPPPRACSSSFPLSQWCHPTISSSIIPVLSCLQSFPASGSFLMSGLFSSGGQSIRASVSASVLSVNIQGWFPLGLSGLISLLSTKLYFLQKNIVFLLSLFLLCPFNYHPKVKNKQKQKVKKKKNQNK